LAITSCKPLLVEVQEAALLLLLQTNAGRKKHEYNEEVATK
jgi:hypothetical protein